MKQAVKEKISIKTIRGKVMSLSIISLCAILILGAVGIFALNKNNSNNKTTSDINKVSLIQNENNTLNTSFLYFLESSYLESIIKNLDKMNTYASDIGVSLPEQSDKANEMTTTIKKDKENYQSLIELSEKRGFVESKGKYVEFVKNDEDLTSQFGAIDVENSWIDGQWLECNIGQGEIVEIGGKKYSKFTYQGEVPQLGKRDVLMIRVAESALVYSGDVYFNNIQLVDGDKKDTFDIGRYEQSDLSNSMGAAIKELDIKAFNELPSFYAKLGFDGNESWTDIQVKVNVEDIDIYKYKKISYDAYFEITDTPMLTINMAFADKYQFQKLLDKINSKFVSYSKAIMEGKDAAEQAEELTGLFDEMESKLKAYVTEEKTINKVMTSITAKRDAFNQILEDDKQITALKKENIALESKLTSICDELKDTIESGTEKTKSLLVVIIFSVILLGALVIGGIALLVVKGLKKNITNFKTTLEGISNGNLTIRATSKGNDEFSEFGRYLNHFADKLAEIMKSVQITVEDVRSKNVTLVKTIHDVVSAESVDSAGILQIQSMFGEITDSVNLQSSNTEECLASISEICSMNDNMIKRIEGTNGKTADTLKQVTNSHDNIKGLKDDIDNINNTVDVATGEINELISKVRSIDEILNAINELSEQTNLLALNASIEASRAGEHGKGFSVVATEIKKLAEQTGSETEKISELTNTINQNIDKVQRANDDVEHTVTMTLEKTDEIEQLMEQVKDASNKSSSDINKVSSDMANQNVAMQEMLDAVAQVSEETERIQDKTITTLNVTSKLAEVLTNSVEDVNKMIKSVEKLKEDINYFNV